MYKKKKSKAALHHSTHPTHTHIHTLPLHCVDAGKEEKAGRSDSAVMALYSRISLFVLVVNVKEKCSSQVRQEVAHAEAQTVHSLLAHYSHI